MDGILIVDKPEDWTSHDVCAFVRGRFRIKKVGHAGTLDPMATGVLVLLLGKGTKQSSALTATDKVYEGVFRLGLQTDSHDRQGKILKEAPWETISLAQIEKASKDFVGEILQTPPMVSAIKIKGKKLYELARKGVVVEREARKVFVHSFDILKKEGALVYFKATVSKGTYVRTLIHDLGESLGCFATLNDLRRTASGQYEIEESITMPELKKISVEDLSSKVIPLGSAPDYAPSQND